MSIQDSNRVATAQSIEIEQLKAEVERLKEEVEQRTLERDRARRIVLRFVRGAKNRAWMQHLLKEPDEGVPISPFENSWLKEVSDE